MDNTVEFGGHSYVLSENSIKVNDWVYVIIEDDYDLLSNKILQVKELSEDANGKPAVLFTADIGYLYTDEVKKIIASSDISLGLPSVNNKNDWEELREEFDRCMEKENLNYLYVSDYDYELLFYKWLVDNYEVPIKKV